MIMMQDMNPQRENYTQQYANTTLQFHCHWQFPWVFFHRMFKTEM